MGKDGKFTFGSEGFKFSFNIMLPIKELLNFIMTSIFARGIAWLLCVVLAFGFGAMFVIGSRALFKVDKNAEKSAAESIVEESDEMNEDATEENSDETDEEVADDEH